jgi:hypothetical protein
VGTRKFLGQTIDVVEVAVGFVLVFLVQFVMVEGLIIESRSDWSGRLGTGEGGRIWVLDMLVLGRRWRSCGRRVSRDSLKGIALQTWGNTSTQVGVNAGLLLSRGVELPL